MVPYLAYGNMEIANAARTYAYLKRFLPTKVWVAGDSCTTCPALGGPFSSPASDNASWYDSSRQSSGFFYGLVLDSIVLPPVLSRSAKPLANGGQSLGRMTVKGRTVQVSGAMFGATESALEYGAHWLAKALAGDCADPCGLSDLCLLPACPEANQTVRWRHLPLSGLIDGPTISIVDGIDGTLMRTVAFQLGSQAGYLFADPTTLLSRGLPAATTVCGIASTTQWIGDATTRITVVAGGPSFVTGLSISAAPLRSNESCPSPSAPVVSFTVPQLAPGSQLVIDGAKRSALVTEVSSGDIIGGLDVINTGGIPLDWIDVGQCARVCICLRATTVNPGTTVLVEQLDRDL